MTSRRASSGFFSTQRRTQFRVVPLLCAEAAFLFEFLWRRPTPDTIPAYGDSPEAGSQRTPKPKMQPKPRRKGDTTQRERGPEPAAYLAISLALPALKLKPSSEFPWGTKARGRGGEKRS